MLGRNLFFSKSIRLPVEYNTKFIYIYPLDGFRDEILGIFSSYTKNLVHDTVRRTDGRDIAIVDARDIDLVAAFSLHDHDLSPLCL